MEPLTPDDLRRLPLRAIVAIAVRCVQCSIVYANGLRRVPSVQEALEKLEQMSGGMLAGFHCTRGMTVSSIACSEAADKCFEECGVLSEQTRKPGDDELTVAPLALLRMLGSAYRAVSLLADLPEKSSIESFGNTIVEYTVRAVTELRRVAGAESERIAEVIHNDYDDLVSFNLGTFPELGEPVGMRNFGQLPPWLLEKD